VIRTRNEIVIRAPAERVYAVAEDKARFASFMPHVLISEESRDGGRVRFRMAARMRYGFVSRWISERVGAETNRWAAYRTEGFCRRMEGRWAVEPLEAGTDGAPRTRLTLIHDFEVGRPLLRLFVPVDRLTASCVEDNSQRMLEAIRRRVESNPG
jgi:ribosome-associated toxin RatA of RatAB toxin-antitoxin module